MRGQGHRTISLGWSEHRDEGQRRGLCEEASGSGPECAEVAAWQVDHVSSTYTETLVS